MEAMDIVDVVSKYLPLISIDGVRYSGNCPFHKDQIQSLMVHRVRRFYHCYGCGVSGDAWRFEKKMAEVPR